MAETRSFKKKTRYKVYDLTFEINNKEYHYIMVCHKVPKQNYLLINVLGNTVNFSIELNPLQTREESEAMFIPMIRNNEYNVRCLTKTLSYKQALKVAKQYKIHYMNACCSINRNYNITNLQINIPKVKQDNMRCKKIPKKLLNIKNPVLRERLIRKYLKKSN